MTALAAALAGLLMLPAALLVAPARATATAATTAHDETADCIAVMQTQADDMARQIKAGDKAQVPALRTELQRAAALIGRRYLDGAHDEAQAKAQLKLAQDAQAAWTPAQRSSLHRACVTMADADLAAANGAQRFVVQRVAQARLQRLLAGP